MADLEASRLVSVSGIDGAGKTSIVSALVAMYPDIFSALPKFKATLPGHLAEILGDGSPATIQPDAVLEGSFAHLYHVARAIEFAGYTSSLEMDPAYPVHLADRWALDWLAWSRTATRFDDAVETILDAAPRPTLAILVDVPVDTALMRIRKRGGAHQLDCAEILEPFRAQLLNSATKASYPVLLLDGARPTDELVASVVDACSQLGENQPQTTRGLLARNREPSI